MIYEVEENHIYASKSGYLCRVLHKAQHGQDCSVPMVVYMNLVDTFDSPAGKVWTVSESFFLGRFSEPTEDQLNVFKEAGK